MTLTKSRGIHYRCAYELFDEPGFDKGISTVVHYTVYPALYMHRLITHREVIENAAY